MVEDNQLAQALPAKAGMLLTPDNIDETTIETKSGARPDSPIVDRFMETTGLLFNERDASDFETLEFLCLLAISGRVEEVIDNGLPTFNTLLEQPTEKWSFLVSIGDQYMEALQRFSRLELINGALKCYYQATSIAPDGALDKPQILGAMGRLHWQRFLKQGDHADINMAISCLNQAVSGISDGHPNKLLALMDLGVAHREKFAHSKANTDIDLAILYHSQVASSVSDDHLDKPIHISHLGNSHLRRFEHFRDFSDLDKSIACHIEAASMTPDGHPCKAGMLSNLASSCFLRFKSIGNLGDLNTTIECYSQAASLTPNENLDDFELFCSLGRAHDHRFRLSEYREDIDKAILGYIHAVSIVSDSSSRKMEALDELGDLHIKRFEHFGEPADLEASIACRSEATTLTPESDPNRPERLSSLAMSYYARFERIENNQDLSAAIACYTEALPLIPNEDQRRMTCLNNLGTCLGTRSEHTGMISDLETAAGYHSQALSMTLDGHPGRPITLHGLGNLHGRRFKRLGELADIDRAITCHNEAISLVSDEHPNVMYFLLSLGGSYRGRHQRLGAPADNELALESFKRAVSLTPDSHPLKPVLLYNLGDSHSVQFEYKNWISDLDEAIGYYNLGLSLTPDEHPCRATGLSSLGTTLYLRYKQLGGLVDLDQSIQCATQAVSLVPDNHPHKATALNVLGRSYHERFLRQGELADIESSIIYRSQAISAITPNDARRPLFLSDLGDSHLARYTHLWEDHDGNLAIGCYMEVAQSPSGKPSLRLRAAFQWAILAAVHQRSQTLDAYTLVMALIPQTVWLGDTTDRRYEQIVEIGSVALKASNSAIQFGSFDLALEWLEQGLSVVWSQLLELRAPLDELACVNSTLAQDLRQTSQALDHALSLEYNSFEVVYNPSVWEETAQQHRRLAEKRERLIKQVQSLPGFEGFLCPKKANELFQAARTTAIVMVVLPKNDLCHALVLQTEGRNTGKIIDLETLSYQKASAARTQMTSLIKRQGRNTRGVHQASKTTQDLREILSMLWADLVQPVLDALGYTNKPPPSQLPHITWCLTGPLTSLPVHAAGDYGKPDCALFDYAISSYTPNLSSLLVPPADLSRSTGMVAVSQKSTSGMETLPGTQPELDQICLRTKDTMPFTRIDGDQATPSAVLTAMERHSWVHLACHASQNPKKPTASAFHLHGGPLDLAAITRKQLKHADLAFLSACQTATGDHDLPEEAVHLAAGMIVAGYRRVIATMWSINDEDAPLIADKFYAYMLDDTIPDVNKAAKALHFAVECLRNEVGVKEFVRWVPYIHIGL